MSYLALDFNQSIPQALQHIPALPPPDGVTPNFVDPPTRSTLLVTVISVLFGLMFIFYLSRVYMKLMIIGEMTLDDLTCTIGLVGAIAYYTGVVVGATRGPIGKHQWDVPRSEEMNMNSIFPLWIRVVVTGPTYLLFKATLFIMYLKIFKPMRWVRVSVYIGLVLLCLFYVPVMVVQFYFATPRPHETWTAHFMSPMQQKTGILLISLPTVGLAFDVYLLLLPMAAISQVQLPPKRKLGVMMIFLSGILACIGCSVSIYYYAKPNPDVTWTMVDILLAEAVEMYLGIICACMPAFSKTACHLLPSLATIRAIMYSCTSGKYLRNFAGDPSRRRQSHFGPSSRLQCLHSENKVAMACGSLFEYEASKSSESGSKNDAPYNLVSIEDLGSSISIAGQ